LVVRLPSAVVDDFVLKIDSLATKIESKDISMTDVTEDFIDVESSLVTKKKLEARYQEILKQAKTVTEIMEIEVRIGTVHAEIESLEGRLNYLTNQTSFGTLTLVFHEPATSTPVALGHELVAAFRNGWSGTLQFLVLLATIWPVLIVAGITTFLYFRFTRVKVSN